MQQFARRSFLGAACVACGGAHLGFHATPVQAQAPAATAPAAGAAGAVRTSRWGPRDEIGAANQPAHPAEGPGGGAPDP
jgi:hypothetical protein